MAASQGRADARIEPRWAVLTVWGVVNAVNLLQSAGFVSRVYTGDRGVNHVLGHAIVALVVPAIVALAAFIRARTSGLLAQESPSQIARP